MALTIFIIAGFQLYWLQNTYEREQRTLEMRSNITFRETVRSLQSSKLKIDKLLGDTALQRQIFFNKEHPGRRSPLSLIPHQKVQGFVDALTKRAKDSTGKMVVVTNRKTGDTVHISRKLSPLQNRLIQFLSDVDSLQDSIRVREIDVALRQKFQEQSIAVPFSVQRVATPQNRDEASYNEITLGFTHPITYGLFLGDTRPYLLKRISIPVLFSIFLVGFTIFSFYLLYRNLRRERRLAAIKNEFISNITHELKTPIATVSVAIEAMRSFSANLDPQRSKEYLNISANELQRLSLLVDKVLKLSMFEKREIELKNELLDMKDLVEEVTSSMRLQFEKRKAIVQITSEGDTTLEGDRLHLVSVIFNLLDNALKYSTDNPVIKIGIKGNGNKVGLCIKDSGIGIPQEFQSRIFEKFFRVPTGNLHNAKGYGLGLSYVAHVVKRHHGEIRVESVEGDGSKFYITLPRQAA